MKCDTWNLMTHAKELLRTSCTRVTYADPVDLEFYQLNINTYYRFIHPFHFMH
jgi:hypothetical protein